MCRNNQKKRTSGPNVGACDIADIFRTLTSAAMCRNNQKKRTSGPNVGACDIADIVSRQTKRRNFVHPINQSIN